MEQITLIKRNGEQIPLISTHPIRAITQAVQDTTLMGDDTVTLSIVSGTLIDFGIGDKIVVGGKEYFTRTIPTREVASDNMFAYEVKFYGVIYELIKSQYRDTDVNGLSKRSTFDLTYSLKDFVKVVIYNVNRDYSGLWYFDEANCPETEPKTLTFSKENCLRVLQRVCNEFKFDFVIEQSRGVRTIKIGKFGEVMNPPGGKSHFEWGKGGGLFNLIEKKVDDKSIITRLWVEGGMQNIRADYRDYSDRLQLPCPLRLNTKEHTLHDGTVVPANTMLIGISEDANRYIEDVALSETVGVIEDTEHFDDIHPQRTGIITAISEEDVYTFIDEGMNFDLNEKDENGNHKYLIDKVSAKITFITGKLAGMQFELEEYSHETFTFKILKYTDERGMSFPTESNEAFRFMPDDKYKITDINLPKEYEDDAEEELWFAGYDKFLQRKQAMAQYELNLDRQYFIENLPEDTLSTVFSPGDYVPVKDVRFGIEKNIRIQNVKRNLLNEYEFSLVLSDTVAISIYDQTVIDLHDINVIISNNGLADLNRMRLGWRTTEELRTLIYDTDGYFDMDNVRANSIDTNMLAVGSRSQQFVLQNTVMQANRDGNPNKFYVSSGVLSHLTIADEIRSWNMSELNYILPNSKAFYVFAKCSKVGNTGVYHVTQEQLKVENPSDNANYYFQVGVIGSLDTSLNFRDFVTTYGFTRINGRTITTGRISSQTGRCYYDLDDEVIAGNIKFIHNGEETDLGNWATETEESITSAQLLVLSSTSAVMPCNASNQALPGQTISFTAKLQHLTGVASFTAVAHTSSGTHNLTLGGSGNTRTLTSSQWATTYIKVVVTATLGGHSDTVTIYRNNEGQVGVAGQGIDNVTEQFYLSTSKTELQGGSWQDSPPTWVQGKWMWTRAKITYKNPYSVSYTTPVCDTTWEIVNEINVGGVNLLRNTDFTRNLKGVQAIGTYSQFFCDNLGRLTIANSTATTIRFRFTTQLNLSTGKTYYFAVDEWWAEFATVGLNTGSRIYVLQRVKAEPSPDSGVRVYYKITPDSNIQGRIEISSIPNSSDLRLKRAMLECATHPSDYSPAYEDTQEYINSVNALALQSAAVTQGFTAINGGLITTIMLLLKNLAGMETAGISGQQGLTGTAYGNIEQGYAPAYWSGGTLQQALAFSYLMWKIDKGTATSNDWNMQMPTVVFLHNGYAKVGGFVIKNNESISMYGGTMDERFTIANRSLTSLETAIGGTSANGYIENNPLTVSSPGVVQLANTLRLRQDNVKLTFTATIMTTCSPLPGHEHEMQGSSLRVELHRNNVFIAELGQVTALNGTNSVAVSRMLHNMGQGIYSIKLIYERGAGSVGSCSINTSRLEWDFAANSISRVELGTNGFMSVNSNSHLYYSGEKGLDYKGILNMPGVLLSARVNAVGGFLHQWGAKKHANNTAQRSSQGRYIVYHSIGHTSYHVTASPSTANRSFHIVNKFSDNFVIEWRTIGSSIQLIDTAFDFQITGDNYTPRTGRD